MTDSKLEQSLQDLHNEIDNTQTDNEHHQAVLDDLKTHVQKAIDEPDEDHHLSLSKRLEDAILMFGIEHPTLTAAIEQVSENLSALGM